MELIYGNPLIMLTSDSTIQDVHDGIYLENSHRNRIIENVVKKSRYGFR